MYEHIFVYFMYKIYYYMFYVQIRDVLNYDIMVSRSFRIETAGLRYVLLKSTGAFCPRLYLSDRAARSGRARDHKYSSGQS